MKCTPLVAVLTLVLGIAQAHIIRSHEGVDNSLGGGKSLAHLLLSSPVKTHKDVADDHRASFLIRPTDGIALKAQQHFAEESLFSGMEKRRRRRRDSDDNSAVPITIANSSKTLTSSAKVSVTNDQPTAVASPPKGPPSASASLLREPSPPRGPKKPREKLIGKEQQKPKIHPASQDGNAKPEKSGGARQKSEPRLPDAHDTSSNNQPVTTNKTKVPGAGGKVEGQSQKSSSQSGGKRERRATQSGKQRKVVKDGKIKGKSHGQ